HHLPDMVRFGLHIGIDARDVKTWQQRFERGIPGAFARANKFVLDEVAKTAVTGFRRDAHNRIISGIEIDDDDAPAAIWVLPYHPHNMQVTARWAPSVRTPIADVCHLLDEDEFSSVLRRIPLIALAIVETIQSMKFENATAAR